MIVNPDKFQDKGLCKDATGLTHKLRFYDNKIEKTKSVILLGILIIKSNLMNYSSYVMLERYVLRPWFNQKLPMDLKGSYVELKKML